MTSKTILATLIALVVISGATTAYALPHTITTLEEMCAKKESNKKNQPADFFCEAIRGLDARITTLENLPAPKDGIDGSLFDDSELQAKIAALDARLTAIEPIVEPPVDGVLAGVWALDGDYQATCDGTFSDDVYNLYSFELASISGNSYTLTIWPSGLTSPMVATIDANIGDTSEGKIIHSFPSISVEYSFTFDTEDHALTSLTIQSENGLCSDTSTVDESNKL